MKSILKGFAAIGWGLMALLVVVAVATKVLGDDDAEGAGDTARPVAAGYDVVDREFQQASRPRVVGRVVIDAADPEATGAALAAAARGMLASDPRAKVGFVFGYGPGDDTESLFTRGVAAVSRDGKGWTGDGRFTTGPMNNVEDGKRVRVVVGGVLADSPTPMDFPR